MPLIHDIDGNESIRPPLGRAGDEGPADNEDEGSKDKNDEGDKDEENDEKGDGDDNDEGEGMHNPSHTTAMQRLQRGGGRRGRGGRGGRGSRGATRGRGKGTRGALQGSGYVKEVARASARAARGRGNKGGTVLDSVEATLDTNGGRGQGRDLSVTSTVGAGTSALQPSRSGRVRKSTVEKLHKCVSFNFVSSLAHCLRWDDQFVTVPKKRKAVGEA